MTHLLPVLPGLEAHASGALWLPDSETVIIADIHLGYSWAQRRRGELGPLADGRTRDKLLQLRADLRPKQVVLLGDVVHAPHSCKPEREYIEETLQILGSSAKLIAVRGNHDRNFGSEFRNLQVQNVETWSTGNLTAAHGDRLTFAWPEHHTLILGHLHPSLAVRDAAGAGHKLPVFLVSSTCLVLPAFSPFARGFDVASGLPPDLLSCFRKNDIDTYAATGRRIVRLGSLHAAIDTMQATDTSSAAHFRRRHQRS